MDQGFFSKLTGALITWIIFPGLFYALIDKLLGDRPFRANLIGIESTFNRPPIHVPYCWRAWAVIRTPFLKLMQMHYKTNCHCYMLMSGVTHKNTFLFNNLELLPINYIHTSTILPWKIYIKLVSKNWCIEFIHILHKRRCITLQEEHKAKLWIKFTDLTFCAGWSIPTFSFKLIVLPE